MIAFLDEYVFHLYNISTLYHASDFHRAVKLGSGNSVVADPYQLLCFGGSAATFERSSPLNST